MKLYAVNVTVASVALQLFVVGDNEDHAISKATEYVGINGEAELTPMEIDDAAAFRIRSTDGLLIL